MEIKVAIRPGNHRELPDTAEGLMQDLVGTAKPHIRSKVEQPMAAPLLMV
jgi:hypothetical protein